MRRILDSLALLLVASSPVSAAGPESWCGTEAGAMERALALHRYRMASGPVAASSAADADVGDVALLEDHGDLVVRQNPFDIDEASLRLAPDPHGGYALARLAIPLPAAGAPLGLGDDDARGLDLPFAFPFYGRAHTRIFVHSDGNLTFDAPDTARSERGLGRLLSGPPRIAPFFADLDPERGGSISAVLAADRAVFVWTDVPGAGQINRNSFAVALSPDGTIDLAWGRLGSREAVVGITPGGALDATAVDLSTPAPAHADGALAERFAESERVDLVAVAERFYRSHPDLFDTLVVYTTRPLNPAAGTLAFELNVRNEIQGIGPAAHRRCRVVGQRGSPGERRIHGHGRPVPRRRRLRDPGPRGRAPLARLRPLPRSCGR